MAVVLNLASNYFNISEYTNIPKNFMLSDNFFFHFQVLGVYFGVVLFMFYFSSIRNFMNYLLGMNKKNTHTYYHFALFYLIKLK
jgi:hypothetical protein